MLQAEKEIQTTPDSKHTLPIAANLLNRQFTAPLPNKSWVTNIIHILTNEGWLYLAAVKDLFNNAIDTGMTQQLVIQALFRAVTAKRPERELIHHSARSRQYCSYAYQRLLQQVDKHASMSRKGGCWNNAPIKAIGVL